MKNGWIKTVAMGITFTLQRLSSHLTLFFIIIYFIFTHTLVLFLFFANWCNIKQISFAAYFDEYQLNFYHLLRTNRIPYVCVVFVNVPYFDNCIKYTAAFIYCLRKYTFIFFQRSVLLSVLGTEILMFKNCTAYLGWKCWLDCLFSVAPATILPWLTVISDTQRLDLNDLGDCVEV